MKPTNYFKLSRITGDWYTSKELDKWWGFVPAKGPANTVGGEIVRAINIIAYRYYNDGDTLTDLLPLCRYLYKNGSFEMKIAIEHMCENSGGISDWYESDLIDLIDETVNYILTHRTLFLLPNSEDAFDYNERFSFEDFIEYDEDDLWYLW